MYLAKYSRTGTRLFAIPIIERTDLAQYSGFWDRGLVVDSDGNAVVAGEIEGVPSSEMTRHMVTGTGKSVNSTSGTGKLAFVIKFDAQGGVLWQEFLPFDGDRQGVSLGIDSQDNIYVSGVPALTKLDPNGSVLWSLDDWGFEGLTGPSRDLTAGAAQVCAIVAYVNVACYSLDGSPLKAVQVFGENARAVAPETIRMTHDNSNLYVVVATAGSESVSLGDQVQAIEGKKEAGALLVLDTSLDSIKWAHAIPRRSGGPLTCDRWCGYARADAFADGTITVAGAKNPRVSWGGQSFENGVPSGFVMQFDSSGTLLGGFELGEYGVGWVYFEDIKYDSDGNVYIGGSFTYQVDFDPRPGGEAFLYAWSYLNGFVLRTDALGTTSIAVASEDKRLEVPDDESDLTVFPNPTQGMLSVKFETRSFEDVTVDLMNVLGERVLQLYRGSSPIDHTVTVDLSHSTLPSGLYFVTWRGSEHIASKAVTVIR